jgi:phenylalanyl-tRNA synthetase beta chain
VDQRLYVAQMDFNSILAAGNGQIVYKPLPKFPAMSRDIAIVCDAKIPVADLRVSIAKASKGLIQEVELFDVYTGAPIPAGKKSVAFSLKLRHIDRTLTDTEADQEIQEVLAQLKADFDADLR